MILSAIVAVAENGVIGTGGELPWHLPDDLKRFKKLTMGHAIIMGRKTFASIGRALPGRRSIVLTRNGGFTAPGAAVAHSWEEAFSECRGEAEVFVIGGASILAEALPRCHRLYLTRIHAAVDGDTRIDLPDLTGWDLISTEFHPADTRHAYAMDFLDYRKPA